MNFRFAPEVAEALETIAGAESVSLTEAIRRALELYARAQGIATPTTAPAKRGRPRS